MEEYLVNADDLLISQRYNEEEKPFIERLILGATAYLMGAGAYNPKNPLTRVVIELMVGHWLDNRELNNTDYIKTGDFPAGLNSLITSLQLDSDWREDIEKG